MARALDKLPMLRTVTKARRSLHVGRPERPLGSSIYAEISEVSEIATSPSCDGKPTNAALSSLIAPILFNDPEDAAKRSDALFLFVLFVLEEDVRPQTHSRGLILMRVTQDGECERLGTFHTQGGEERQSCSS